MAKEYVYRREAGVEPQGLVAIDGMDCVFIDSASSAMKHFAALRSEFGPIGAIKAVAKVMSGRRFLYAFVLDGRLAAHVWSAPRSPKYPIESDACVLGPLRTRADLRRRGLGTAVLRNAAALLGQRGYRNLYIDTTEQNVASQRTIAGAGFAPFGTIEGGVFRQNS